MTTTQVPQPDVDKALPVVEKPDLYSALQIAIAAALGSFLAAGFLARANLVALDKHKRANAVLVISIVLTLATIAVAIFLPKVPSPAFAVTAIIASRSAAKAEFGAVDVRNRRSWAGVVGAGLAAMFAVIAVVFAAAFVLPESVFNGEIW